MRARIIIVDVPEAAFDAAEQAATHVLVPAAREESGYRGYIALLDRTTGRSMSVTLWEDDETEVASDAAARDRREQGVKALGATVVAVEKYDVVHSELV